MLLKKFECAKKRLAKPAYDGLATLLDVQLVTEWKEQERQAMKEHGDQLQIYDLKLEKGKCSLI